MKYFYLVFFLIGLLLSNKEEQISFLVKYNGIKAGEAVLEKSISNHNINLTFNLKSRKFIDLIYKLRENLSITVDKQNFSILNINKSTQQGKYKKAFQASFDYNNSIGYINNNKIQIQNSIYDPISIIYHLRNEDLNQKKIFEYDIISKENIKKIIMQVVENEKITINNKDYECTVLEAIDQSIKEKSQSGIFKLWISSDINMLPIIIQKKANSGIIKMEISNYEIFE